MTIKKIILQVLEAKNPNWTFGYELEKVDTPWGWIGNSGMVRARELWREGMVEKRESTEGYIQYRPKQPPAEQGTLFGDN